MVITPTQALTAGVVVFVAALWPVLSLRIGTPTSWFGDFFFLLSFQLSLLAAPSLCIATFMDLIRRKADARLLVAFVLSLAGVAAMSIFIYLRIHHHGRAA